MSLLNVPIGAKAPHIFNTVIEIPRGSTNKYEVDSRTGMIRLDRVLYSPLYYPFDYGYIPQTTARDGDTLDVLVMISHPTFPGCIVEAKPLGVLLMKDDKGPDEKIICAATKDPRYEGLHSLDDLEQHLLKEVTHFFEIYKELEEKMVEVIGWKGLDEATALVQRYRNDWLGVRNAEL
jgi:inorganic pyrophosphatase